MWRQYTAILSLLKYEPGDWLQKTFAYLLLLYNFGSVINAYMFFFLKKKTHLQLPKKMEQLFLL